MEYQEIITEEQVTLLVHEMYRVYRKGGLPVLMAPPGAGKTRRVIIKLVDLLGKAIVSFPYHPLVDEFYSLVKDRKAVALAGGHKLCLGELTNSFRYFTGRCQYCRYLYRTMPLKLPVHHSDLRHLVLSGICPYNVLKSNVANADLIIKTHSFVVRLESPLVYDEVHQDPLGRIIVKDRVPWCKKTKNELLAELEELRQKCLMDDCSDSDVEKIELLQELINGECHDIDENSVILVKNPPQKISFGLTATPPLRIPKKWDVINVDIKRRPKMVAVPNVRTARPYDISEFLALYEHLRKLHNGDIYLAAPQRVLDSVQSNKKFAIWGRESHGLTYSSSAILIAEPWLHAAAYEKLPHVATQLTLIQLVQVAGRIRPWNRPDRITYVVGPMVGKYESYFSEFFDIEFVLWDGQELRRI